MENHNLAQVYLHSQSKVKKSWPRVASAEMRTMWAGVVGSQIHLDAKPYTVIGVLPEWFTYPDAKLQVWVPYASGSPPAILQHHDFHFSRVVARLRPDESLASTPIFIVLWLGFLLGWLVLVIFGAMPLFRRRPNSKLR
jgi:hypothetical protein